MSEKEEKSGGIKYDEAKPNYSYLPAFALDEVAKVMTYGAKKYGGFNYLQGISYTRLLSASMRHCFAYLRGEDLDPESGLPHWAHLAANALMLGEMTILDKKELDDRFVYPKSLVNNEVKGTVDGSCPACHAKLICGGLTNQGVYTLCENGHQSFPEQQGLYPNTYLKRWYNK